MSLLMRRKFARRGEWPGRKSWTFDLALILAAGLTACATGGAGTAEPVAAESVAAESATDEGARNGGHTESVSVPVALEVQEAEDRKFSPSTLEPQSAVGVRPRTAGQPSPWREVRGFRGSGSGAVSKFATSADRGPDRRRSLDKRLALRVFEGAPPVMLHSSEYGKPGKTCVDCHAQGIQLGERVGHPMSHAPLTECLQCHVESRNRAFPEAEDPDNEFVGMITYGLGQRSSFGAPPSMPHPANMRGRCLACHGELGYPGMRTLHPQRTQCVACHVPSETASTFFPFAEKAFFAEKD